VLTRKSLVRPARRGERPIERASCWFPPKFLLGKRLAGRRTLYVDDAARVGLGPTRSVETGRWPGAGASGHGLVSSQCEAD